MKRTAKTSTIIFSLIFCLNLLVTTANAVPPLIVERATPAMLLEAVTKRLNLPANTSMDELIELGVINNVEKDFLQSHPYFTYGIAWRVLMPLYGIYSYPAEFYQELLPLSDYGSIYTEAHIAAVLSGLTKPDASGPNWAVSIENFNHLLNKLESGHFLLIDTPPVPLPESLANTTWTLENYQYRNAVLLAHYLIPDSWFEDFQAKGWQMEYQPKFDPAQHSARSQATSDYDRYIGLTSFQDKTIYLRQGNSFVVIHEFTHYVAYRVGWNDWSSNFLKPYFQEEAAKVAHLLRDYSQTNPDEYLADFMTYWLIYPQLQEELTLNAPKTAALVTRLINEYADMTKN